MSRKSFVVRRALGLGLAIALLLGLQALSSATAPPSAERATPAAARASATGPAAPVEPCAVKPCPTVFHSQVVICDWCATFTLFFDPSDGDVLPSQGFAFVIDNLSPFELVIVDASGAPVARIGAGASVALSTRGRGTFQYTIASPRSRTPAVLTIVARKEG